MSLYRSNICTIPYTKSDHQCRAHPLEVCCTAIYTSLSRLEKRQPDNIRIVHQQQKMAATPSHAIEELLTSYHELNHDFVDELTDLPTPLEFMRRTLYRAQISGLSLFLNLNAKLMISIINRCGGQ